MRCGKETTSGQAACIGLMLVIITVAGVIAHANLFSFLMVTCLGTPGLILLLNSLLEL